MRAAQRAFEPLARSKGLIQALRGVFDTLEADRGASARPPASSRARAATGAAPPRAARGAPAVPCRGRGYRCASRAQTAAKASSAFDLEAPPRKKPRARRAWRGAPRSGPPLPRPAASLRQRARAKREFSFEGSSRKGQPLTWQVATRRALGTERNGRAWIDAVLARKRGACRRDRRDRTMRHAHQHRLGLVIERMGRDEEDAPRSRASARAARRSARRGPAPGCASRACALPRSASRAPGRNRCAQAADLLGFAARILPQAMIHRRDLGPAAVRSAVATRAQSRMRATESGPPETASRARLAAPKRAGERSCRASSRPIGALAAVFRAPSFARRSFRRPEAFLRVDPLAQLGHFARCCSRCTSFKRAGRPSGIFVPTSAKVAQAWSLAPSPRKETPSLSMLSGPLGEPP